jgi:hypothetical protein
MYSSTADDVFVCFVVLGKAPRSFRLGERSASELHHRDL